MTRITVTFDPCFRWREVTALRVILAGGSVRCPPRHRRFSAPPPRGERAAWRVHGNVRTTKTVIRPPNVLGVSCTAGPARRSRSGTAVAANDVREEQSGDLQPSWRRHAGDEVGSSAAGPKPGRASFTPKLGAADLRVAM